MFALSQKFFKPFKAIFSSIFLPTFFLLLIMLLSPANRAYCFQVTLAWDANTEADLAGYRIFYRQEGQSYNYTNPAWEGTTTSATVTSIDPDDTTTYYFVARAFDINGNESENSDELSYTQEVATMETSNQPPIADAGADQIEPAGTIIFLNGSNSSDPDGDSLSYAWTQVGGPNVTLDDAGSSQASFALPSEGVDGQIFSFQLTVKDPGGLQSTDTCSVKAITAFSSEGYFNLSVDAYKKKGDKYAELTWSGASLENVDVYRDGVKIDTTANDGEYVHGPFGKGKPATYQVCEAGTSNCSNEITVSW
jgi:hypothetical protein